MQHLTQFTLIAALLFSGTLLADTTIIYEDRLDTGGQSHSDTGAMPFTLLPWTAATGQNESSGIAVFILPETLIAYAPAGKSTMEQLLVSNQGLTAVVWTAIVSDDPTCPLPGIQQPWISIPDWSGIVPSQSKTTFVVILDASNLADGGYTTNICVFVDDVTFVVPVHFGVGDEIFHDGFEP